MIAKDNMLFFVGNCLTCFLDPWFKDNVASDATELAQLVENGQDITKREFLDKVFIEPPHFMMLKLPSSNCLFGFNQEKKVAWIHDINKDVHYFYADNDV